VHWAEVQFLGTAIPPRLCLGLSERSLRPHARYEIVLGVDVLRDFELVYNGPGGWFELRW
jgi:hypothetical protein